MGREVDGHLVSVKPGQWVTSSAGRDIGAHYLVLDVVEERFALVADGVKRTVAKPKKKNIRHLWVHDEIHTEIAARLSNGAKVTDEQIRAALRELVGEREEVDGPHGQAGRH